MKLLKFDGEQRARKHDRIWCNESSKRMAKEKYTIPHLNEAHGGGFCTMRVQKNDGWMHFGQQFSKRLQLLCKREERQKHWRRKAFQIFWDCRSSGRSGRWTWILHSSRFEGVPIMKCGATRACSLNSLLFFIFIFKCQNAWYMGCICDNKEWDLN